MFFKIDFDHFKELSFAHLFNEARKKFTSYGVSMLLSKKIILPYFDLNRDFKRYFFPYFVSFGSTKKKSGLIWHEHTSFEKINLPILDPNRETKMSLFMIYVLRLIWTIAFCIHKANGLSCVHIRNLACLMWTLVDFRQNFAHFAHYDAVFCRMYTLDKIEKKIKPCFIIIQKASTYQGRNTTLNYNI